MKDKIRDSEFLEKCDIVRHTAFVEAMLETNYELFGQFFDPLG